MRHLQGLLKASLRPGPGLAALGLLGALLLVAGAARLGSRPGRAVTPDRDAPADLAPGPAPPRVEGATNSIGLELVRVPAGEFLMGGQEPAEQLARAFAAYGRKPDYFQDEYPRHRVRITRPFFLSRVEVTVGQFRQFVRETGYRAEAERDGTGGWGYNPVTRKCEGRKPRYSWHDPGFPQTEEHPVVNVTWNDAVAFCRWLGGREGRTCRLPTEAEWEYSCRAGTATRYCNGDDPRALAEVARVMDDRGRTSFPHVQQLVTPAGEPGRFTAPVGRLKPNGFGLCDMHGNVWEWCSDWYDEDYYVRSPAEDPPGPDAGVVRVRRGGGWNSFPLWARASFRNYNTPESRCVNLGFRVVQEITAP